ncbi:MAG: hypothetical protein EON58_08380 [Alphaproteobacteria bacterium]|nr:MAG: hypothetical protein EON58_08380 [Alphaproteobacteria bacterium]
MTKLLATLVVVLTLTGCRGVGTPVVIINNSTVTLESVQARGPGFAAFVGDIGPGERKKIEIYPSGEAGLGLTFKAMNRDFKSPVSGYFEPSYEVSVTVSRDMSVDVIGEF